ncbi:SIR2 family protein [Verminephrobacter eiseniae]|uniref:SIR2 family protein n=1 Tax=Verminephrobacter eiseniae TaxID=364317 RepID=UPI0022375920|nr:SIR2 family protein [Verminephrobacter eiseniae]MCW5234340.1 SIR2 family protein [Verminephrobacter eiseniae]MCW5294102.1 SIR2 family protein [Verminephrobacter eiseniae]MCW8183159.1 SIR2 family protein [Verminephrobacter eiseniae]MCW8222100.1 SIR2 family protein [Verminephrobacter eiseniae]MCW8232694.1 SIR2 family protein [Verminephrobacter eiseniae]
MSTSFHCPYRQSTLLQQALAPDKMRIAFLLGAGCPVSIRVLDPDSAEKKALIPDISGLTEHVKKTLADSEKHQAAYDKLTNRLKGDSSAAPTIEDILSHIRALQDVVRDSTIDGLDKTALYDLDKEICDIITKVVGVDLPESSTPYHRFATWIRDIQREHPIEIFTPNYDLLVEQALESQGVPYFDGFVGSKQAFFDLASMESHDPPSRYYDLPSRWVRLWKVHGSVNWWRTPKDEIVRRTEYSGSDRQMIYPSHLKFNQSRRMPYLAMLDRLREFLARGQAVLVTNGYSFGDEHLNEVILHGLRSNPTAICFALLFGSRSRYDVAMNKARIHSNLSLLAEDGAVLGTVEGDWPNDAQPGHALHKISVVVDDSEEAKCKFLLGDFEHFGTFLAQQLSRPNDGVVGTHAT